MLDDGLWLPAGLALYVGAACCAVVLSGRAAASYRVPMLLLALALSTHGVAIALRWVRLGHGPYVDLFEILSSNIWSLHLAVLAACVLFPRIRPSLGATLPVLQVLVLWLLSVSPSDAEAPVTYQTPWLAVHLTLGKVFLGCTAVAVGLSLVILVRRYAKRIFAAMPGDTALDELAYRFILIAFIFESLMLVAGAIWAHDAWGRYWAWDPLETWAFVTWLAVIAYLHLRAIRRPSPRLGAIFVIGIFVLAFATFFGMPFVSTAPHKGAI